MSRMFMTNPEAMGLLNRKQSYTGHPDLGAQVDEDTWLRRASSSTRWASLTWIPARHPVTRVGWAPRAPSPRASVLTRTDYLSPGAGASS